ncbi:hypothetical protein C1752_00838 [Acaryochloris thomasi RCC1774]|uniref:DUF4335 domain-containing protein n=1 Tax=Acaryochloris thomasi RCC1774 TaxID=1764569 RepID=A0A2W1JMS4_9CYAN|nr:DUF4335 domain-containing protein [Acaryochloris thomasi]PZD74516.1 hypothetical protein C1752_00838 [Acaryochloris thomasi RCC1774]
MAVITRQYAPPTCTLEVTAQTSALSRWTRQPVLKSLDFLLSFKGVCDRNQQPLEVQGDRKQLESLSEAVSTYTQELLGHSVVPLPAGLSGSENPQTELQTQSATALETSPAPPLTLPVVHLRPQNLLRHELVLGPLATDTSGSVIQLKASQLFDLATALDEYAAEVETLPTQVPQTVRPAVPVWARAAGVILLVGGSTVALTQFLYSGFGGPTSTISSDSRNEKETLTESAPTPVAKLPTPQRDQASPPTPPTQKLPQVQLPKRGGDSGSDLFSGPAPSQSESQTESSTSAFRQTPRQQAPPAKLPSLPDAPAPADLDLDSEKFKVPDAAEAPTAIAGRSPTELGQTNLGRSGVSASQPETFTSRAKARVSAESDVISSADQENSLRQDKAVSPAPAAGVSGASVPPPTPEALRETAFDVSPQIVEVRQYLARRWQAPANLKQTLQYTLVLNANGTIGQIKPRGQAATQYLGQTPIPSTNQPFVSPSKVPGSAVIRVVLGADGSVQTFPESPSN